MPIGSSWESTSWVEDSWVDLSWGGDTTTVADFTLPLSAGATDTLLHAESSLILALHANITDTLMHAEETVGERNMVYILATLTDESGEVLVDENGEVLEGYGETPVIVLHASYTDTLLHAEDIQ